MHTTTTLPTSPDFWALIPVSMAICKACARGEPPPQGMDSNLFFAIAIDFVGGSKTSAMSPWKGMREIWSRLWYASVRRLIAAPFAAFIRFKAIDPEASTTKIMRDPAFLAIFLIRTSDCSMCTPRPSFLVPIARWRRDFWYGAEARRVASTARRVTLPFGNIGLMYRPRSCEKIRPLPPPFPARSREVKSIRSGSMGVASTSNINSWGTSGTSGWSGSSSSGSSFSSSSSSSSFSSSSSLSSFCSSICGGGGGGGGGGIISSSSMGVLMNVPRGAMASFTASLKSSEVICLPSSAAEARATSEAKISARCPWQPARIASSQRY
mmetsp:Transcript_36848/g.49341  ORF Transcript_36848/g.49341 Transcript_36848/m.49341 type:complete len:324 (+) Transcript_36848:380-1351(+)